MTREQRESIAADIEADEGLPPGTIDPDSVELVEWDDLPPEMQRQALQDFPFVQPPDDFEQLLEESIPFPEDLRRQIEELTKGVEVDLDAELPPEKE